MSSGTFLEESHPSLTSDSGILWVSEAICVSSPYLE
jgi:hypothetical protein